MKHISKTLLLSLFVLLTAHLWVQAQSRIVTSTITREYAGNFAGVTVGAKGTTIGTITDPNGAYKLSIPASTTNLIFPAVGMGCPPLRY